MLCGYIKGDAIYFILYAARAQYGIYCAGADILHGGKVLVTHTYHMWPSPSKAKKKKNGTGRDRVV